MLLGTSFVASLGVSSIDLPENPFDSLATNSFTSVELSRPWNITPRLSCWASVHPVRQYPVNCIGNKQYKALLQDRVYSSSHPPEQAWT